MDNIFTYNRLTSWLIAPKSIECGMNQKREEYLVASIVNGYAHVSEVPYKSYNLYRREKVIRMHLGFE